LVGWLAALATLLIYPGVWLFFFAERECERQMEMLERPWILTYFRSIGAIFIVFAVLSGWSFVRGGLFATADAATTSSPLWLPIPGVAELPPTDTSREICDRTSELKSRFSAASTHTAMLGYVVRPNGTIHDIAVAGSSGSPALDKAIVACVATLRFRPLKGGQAMMVQWKSSN
jgi:TonB family protein